MTQLAPQSPTFPIGSLVTARGREWVVLPGSDAAFLVLRPLGGGDDDVAGVFVDEGVSHATFTVPDADDLGDDLSGRLLRDALRIGFRSSAGPFRSIAALGVDPRPYQMVPLLLALRQQTIRLLIADDVGIGKTIEAGLIAAELLAQGSVERLSVLCPPSLADQWRDELSSKFGIAAELVLPATVRRLERGLEYGQSIFERHPVTIVSTDYIKSDVRRDDFLRAAPELIIVDEAHSCVSDDTGSSRGRTQRYRLLKDLAADTGRHLVLVTATPHSGKEAAFRNLIGLLDPVLTGLDLTGEAGRKRLAAHLVQRRRADIRDYLGADTRFPKDRTTAEHTYQLSPVYRGLFDDVMTYVEGQVTDSSGSRVQQRVRWWSALSLLRAMASSPAAAAATLATRTTTLAASSDAAVDTIGAAGLFDLIEDEALDVADAVPGALLDDAAPRGRHRSLLRELRDRVAAIAEETDPRQRVAADTKLDLLTTTVRQLLTDGFHPIVFCRFIPTAHYIAGHLAGALPKATVEVVTGELPPEDRAERVRDIARRAGSNAKVLVATDCLSEGVNLQDDFQAVVHYDLAWNPTRHEQREGRVDRFGQPAPTVRAVTLFGADNGIDGVVMDVLIRKHEAIRRDLGISVPVPASHDAVLTTLMDRVMRRGRRYVQETLDLDLPGVASQLEFDWESSAEAEKRSRSRYAQHSIRPDEVAREVDAMRAALGSPDDVADFVRTALQECGATIAAQPYGFDAHPAGLPIGLRDALGRPDNAVPFYRDLPAPRGVAVLARTDPTTAAIARYTLDAALDPVLSTTARPARRCAVIRTNGVTTPTVLLLTRIRANLTLPGRAGPRSQVAEEARALAFTGIPTAPQWLDPDAVEALLSARPDGNIPPDVARNISRGVLAALGAITPHLERYADDLAVTLREAHVRVRTAARGDRAGDLGIRGLTVEARLPVDILGAYIYQPAGTR